MPTHRPDQNAAPAGSTVSRIPIYTQEFADDPHRFYRHMRQQFGPLAPVDLAPGVPATLVIGYRTAVRILDDTTRFPSDPRAWQQKAPVDLPILPLMQWRPSPIRTHGAEHARYRTVTVDALSGIDLNSLRTFVPRIAFGLINRFCTDGHADLVTQYIVPLVHRALDHMLGCPSDLGDQLMRAITPLFELNADEDAGTLAHGALTELIARKRADPGDDITTRLIQHPAQLSDEELIQQLLALYWAAIDPPRNLIADALLLMVTDPRYATNQVGFAPPMQSAVDEILATDPPVANHCLTYPTQPVQIDDVWLPADQPVVVSLAACNNDPGRDAGQLPGTGTSLAWGAGPHTCPAHAQGLSRLLAEEAVEQLLDALPELWPTPALEEMVWQPGPFQRALTSLPVEFPPVPSMNVL